MMLKNGHMQLKIKLVQYNIQVSDVQLVKMMIFTRIFYEF